MNNMEAHVLKDSSNSLSLHHLHQGLHPLASSDTLQSEMFEVAKHRFHFLIWYHDACKDHSITAIVQTDDRNAWHTISIHLNMYCQTPPYHCNPNSPEVIGNHNKTCFSYVFLYLPVVKKKSGSFLLLFAIVSMHVATSPFAISLLVSRQHKL
jgi:hypothetical protein